jgi:hypothetical protein
MSRGTFDFSKEICKGMINIRIAVFMGPCSEVQDDRRESKNVQNRYIQWSVELFREGWKIKIELVPKFT